MTPSRDFIGDKKPKEGTINPRSLSDDKQTFGVSGIGYWYTEDKLKEAIKELKKKWKAKCKRMETMSGDVAMLELFWLLEDSFGKELVEAGE